MKLPATAKIDPTNYWKSSWLDEAVIINSLITYLIHLFGGQSPLLQQKSLVADERQKTPKKSAKRFAKQKCHPCSSAINL